MKIIGPGTISGFWAGILFEHVRSFEVTLDRNLGHGFTINGADDNQISYNKITGNGGGYGILLFIAARNLVSNNQVFSNHSGIVIEHSDNSSVGNTITHNTSRETADGDMGDTWFDCTHNTWTNNGFGTRTRPASSNL
ncbi:MAG: right-handed parallel beta-helix repeat-containing protein [Gemmatimonadota bacterium]